MIRVLACPADQTDLRVHDGGLVCDRGHQFLVENGVPILTDNVRREVVPQNMAPCQHLEQDISIDPFVSDWLVNTNGNLYWRARGNLRRYPIPRWPFFHGDGQLLVDVGCGWGRWSIAAARAGFKPIGIDVHIDALAAAGRVTRQVGVQADFVCAGAERLPFRSGSIDVLFSYSVLQHLDREKVAAFFKEASRVLKPDGACLIQLPNKTGLYNILLQAKRNFTDARPGTFEMRYWSKSNIQSVVEKAGLEKLKILTDGFFTQNPQLSDLDLLTTAGKLVVMASHAGRWAAGVLPALTYFADSLWIEARAPSVGQKQG
jgi:2-polyprenyl-3-methyl-5-hydroxy-6-metoxy-1,4-benzoquinol methylase